MTGQPLAAPLANRNRRVALLALGTAGAMLALGFASVPLYRLFCQVTGFGGTTMRASAEQAAAIKVVDKTIVVRFDANINGSLPWTFKPEQVTRTGRIGERQMVAYHARNNADRPVTGQAVFNVTPETAGQYFHKIECFCFTQQTLQAGQEVRMPVIYYVDPKILEDENTEGISEITLSYTFLEAAGTQTASGKTAAK